MRFSIEQGMAAFPWGASAELSGVSECLVFPNNLTSAFLGGNCMDREFQGCAPGPECSVTHTPQAFHAPGEPAPSPCLSCASRRMQAGVQK